MTEFIAQHADLEQPKLILAMREELTNRMREQILWVPDDENYEKNWEELSHNRPAHKNWFPKHRMPKWLLLLMLTLMAPLALIAGIVTLPLWLA
jgi:hypothetical protein